MVIIAQKSLKMRVSSSELSLASHREAAGSGRTHVASIQCGWFAMGRAIGHVVHRNGVQIAENSQNSSKFLAIASRTEQPVSIQRAGYRGGYI